MKGKHLVAALATGILGTLGGCMPDDRRMGEGAARSGPPYTVEDRLAEFGSAAAERLQPHFVRAGVAYPPAEVALLGLKAEKQLIVYARASGAEWRWIHTYPVLAASGGPGPKLREGDLQVPEGVYGIELLNPNSRFHVSLRVNYPSAADRARAKAEGRTGLGGDIMIHGRAASVGCLAMGDPAAEELFTLAAAVGVENIRVLLAPVDLRERPPPEVPNAPDWLSEVYAELAAELQKFPAAGR